MEGEKNKGYLFFYSPKVKQTGFLSQWFYNTIEEDGISFNCAEQYMMYKKAKLFGDNIIAERILNTRSPSGQRKKGRFVLDFDKDIWEEHKYEIVKQGNRLKFQQNVDLKKKLLETKEKVLVEASPSDRIWGIGMSVGNPNVHYPETWGQNLLGKILMELRDEFLSVENKRN